MKIRVAGIQLGPFSSTYENNWKKISRITEEMIISHNPAIISYSELMAAPYFVSVKDESFFNKYAEPINGNGNTVKKLSDISTTYNVHVIGTLFEKAIENGQVNYYNSAFVCSPTKGVIGRYRNVHLSPINSLAKKNHKKYYFEERGGGGKEFPVFKLDNGLKVGILICFDRSFPEAWKALSLQGADLIVLPTAASELRKELYVEELRIRAMENNIFVLAVNKAGKEQIGNEPQTFFGHSCLIDPFGKIITTANELEWTYILGEIDTALINDSKTKFDWNKERKANIYHKYLRN